MSNSEQYQSIRGAMSVAELRTRIFANKEVRRHRQASLSIQEKFRIIEQMKRDADALRKLRQARVQAA